MARSFNNVGASHSVIRMLASGVAQLSYVRRRCHKGINNPDFEANLLVFKSKIFKQEEKEAQSDDVAVPKTANEAKQNGKLKSSLVAEEGDFKRLSRKRTSPDSVCSTLAAKKLALDADEKKDEGETISFGVHGTSIDFALYNAIDWDYPEEATDLLLAVLLEAENAEESSEGLSTSTKRGSNKKKLEDVVTLVSTMSGMSKEGIVLGISNSFLKMT